MSRKRRVLTIFLLLIILLNNSITLVEAVGYKKENLKFNVGFDIFGENRSINGGEQLTEIEITGDDASIGEILEADQIVGVIRNSSNVFIIDSGYSPEEIEIISKNNCNKSYYIHMDRIKEVYGDGMVRYIGHDGNNIRFLINGKKIAEEYNKGNYNIDYKIYFTLENGIVVKNEAECQETPPKEPEIENFPEYREYYSISRNGKFDADVLNIVGGDDPSKNKLYRENIYGSRLPSKSFNSRDIDQYLDLKDKAIFQDKINIYFENNQKEEIEYFFNLIGYEMQESGKARLEIESISQIEYNLIELIGIDKFVYLKSRDKSFLMDYEEGVDYRFNYSHDDKSDTISLEFKGKISALEEVKEPSKTYIKSFLDKMGSNLKLSLAKEGKPIESLEDRVKVINSLIEDPIGSNIISEILRGENRYERDKEYNDLTQIELNEKYEKIRVDLNNKREESIDQINKIKDIEYMPIENKRSKRSLQSFTSASIKEKNRYNQFNYRYKKVKDYFDGAMLEDLNIKKTEDRGQDTPRKIKDILDDIVIVNKEILQQEDKSSDLESDIKNHLSNILEKNFKAEKYDYLKKLETALKEYKAGDDHENAELDREDLKISDIPKMEELENLKDYKDYNIVKKKLDGEIEKIDKSRPIIDKLKEYKDEEILDILSSIEDEDFKSLEDIKEKIVDPINSDIEDIKKMYEDLKKLDSSKDDLNNDKLGSKNKEEDLKKELDEKAKDENEEIKNKINSLIKKKQAIVRNINRLRSELYREELNKYNLDSELVRLEYNYIRSSAEVERVRAIINGLKNQEDIAYYERELEYLKRFSENDRLKRDNKKEEVGISAEKIKELKEELELKEAGQKQEQADLDKQIEVEEAKLKDKTDALIEAIEKVKTSKELGDLSKENEENYDNIVKLKSEIDNLTGDIRVIENKLKNLDKQIASLESKKLKEEDFLDNTIRRRDDLELNNSSISLKLEDINSLREENSKLIGKMTILEMDLRKINIELEKLKEELKENLSEEDRNKLEEKIEKKKKEISIAETNFKDLRDTEKKNQENIKDLKIQLEDLENEREAILKSVYKNPTDYLKDEKDILEKEKNIGNKKEQILVKKELIEKLKKELENLQDDEKAEKEEEIKKAEEELEALEGELENLELGLKKKKEDVYLDHELLSEREARIEALEKDKLVLEGESATLNEKLKEKEAEIEGKEGKIKALLEKINKEDETNQAIKDGKKDAIEEQKKLIEKEKELTEYLKETIRASSERKELEIKELKDLASILGQLEYYKEVLDSDSNLLNEDDLYKELELLLGEAEYKSDFIKTYKFQRDRYDYDHINRRFKEEKAGLKSELTGYKEKFKEEKAALKKAREGKFGINDSLIERLLSLDLSDDGKYKIEKSGIDNNISLLEERIEKYNGLTEEEKNLEPIMDSLIKLEEFKRTINIKIKDLEQFNGAKKSDGQKYKHPKLELYEIKEIENILVKEDIDFDEINKKIGDMKTSYDSFVDDFDDKKSILQAIKEEIPAYKVYKIKTISESIAYNKAINEIDEHIKALEVQEKSIDQIENLFSSNPLNGGKIQRGGSFKLLYQISENNEGEDEDHIVNIPWIQLEELDSMGEVPSGYINIEVSHISGLFNMGQDTLTRKQKEELYNIFNPTVNPSGNISLVDEYGDIPMEMKFPKNKKLLITDQLIREKLDERITYSKLGGFGLKLAYIKIDDQIIWRDQIRDESSILDGENFKLEDGKLNIYFDKLQKDNEKLTEKYSQEESEDEKAKILEEIRANIEAMKDMKAGPKIQLVFEDELNVNFFIDYIGEDGKNILDRARIKGLEGAEYSLDGPKYIVNEKGEKYELVGPKSHLISTRKTKENKIYEFKYRPIGRSQLGEVYDIPGYEVKEVKVPGQDVNYEIKRIQEDLVDDRKDKNIQANLGLKDQRKLNIRYIDVSICSKDDCDVHTGEDRGTRLGREKIGWFHSSMYLPYDKDLSLDLSPYLEKYSKSISSYGLEEGERDAMYPINIPEDGLIKIDRELGSASKEIYLNLYKVDYLPHYSSGGGGSGGGSGGGKPEKRYFEYTIDHNYYNREIEKKINEEGEVIEIITGDYSPYIDARGDYSINIKYDKGVLNSVMNTNFTNFIYKYWDKYSKYVLDKDDEDRTFDKLVIKEIKYETKKKPDGSEYIEELVTNRRELLHNPTLKKGIYKYRKVEDTDIYEINFRTTSSDSIIESDWYKFEGFEDESNKRESINLYKELNPSREKNRKTLFEYYFTGSPIWTPEIVKTKLIEEHVDIMTGQVFFSSESELYVNDLITVLKPDEESWPKNYDYIHTKPEVEDFRAAEGINKISHYYLSKDYINIKYHSNGGSFNEGGDFDITSDDRKERIVIAKEDELLKDYHPQDISRVGHKFIGWAEKIYKDSGNYDFILVEDDRLVEKDLELYALWEKKSEPPVVGPEEEDDKDKDSSHNLIQIVPDDFMGEDKENKIIRLNKEDHMEYIIGDNKGRVRPEDYISREETAAIFYRLLDLNDRKAIYSEDNDFKDLSKKRWSNKHISTLANANILKGYEDGEFKPGNYISRGELATIASKFDQLEKAEGNFSDVSGHWAEKYIGSAVKKGWIKGYPDGSFKPDQNITRAELVSFVNNVLERKVLKENIPQGVREFPDLKEHKWYYEAMVEAINGHTYIKEEGIEIWQELKEFQYDM